MLEHPAIRSAALARLFGAGMPAGRLLGQEPRGFAVDFTQQSLLIRGPGYNWRGAPDNKLTCVNGAAYRTGPSGLLVSTAANTLRYEYDPLTLQCLGLLVEEQRTNLTNYSEQVDNSYWAKNGGATVSANAATAPDGNVTADKLVEPAASNNPRFYNAYPISISNQPYTFSVYAKAAGRNWLIINAFDAGNKKTWFNLSTGTIGTNTAGNTANIIALPNGWYRCSVTRTVGASASGYYQIEMSNADNVSTYTGDGSSGIYIWGTQWEAGIAATSYVPTTSAQATRSADLVYLLASSAPIGTVHSLYTKARISDVAYSNLRSGVGLRNSSTDGMWIGLSSGNGDPTLFCYVAGSQALITTGGAAAVNNTYFKVAGRFGANDFQLASGGVLGTPDTSGTVPTGIDRISFGLYDFGAGYLNGIVAEAVYVPRLWANAELQARAPA